jgi:HSP20 family protein
MTLRSFLPSIFTSGNNGTIDPFSSLRHEVDRAFESFGKLSPSAAWANGMNAPKVNLVQKDQMMEVTAELPGVELKDVELLVDDDILTIKGEKKSEKEEKNAESYIRECSYGSFSRSIQLPFDIDSKKVVAAFKNGILTVTVPVPAQIESKAQKVQITAMH